MTYFNYLIGVTEIKNFINENLIFIVIGFSLVLIILIFVLVKILNKKKNIQKQLAKIEQDYAQTRQLALPDAIAKLETLAMKNISFVEIYKESNTRFYQIHDTFTGQINEKFELVNTLLDKKDYKVLNKEMENLRTLINAFSSEINTLYNKVCNYTAEEEMIANSLRKLKEEYINDQKIFNDNAKALAIIAPRIKDMMRKISLMFDECEGNLSAGVYVDCFEIIEKIKNELKELNKYLDKMPGLLTWTTQNILKKLNDLIDKNNSMQNEFPLHHLLPTRKIEKLKNEFNLMINKIKSLDAEGIEDYMKELSEQITALSDSLDQEKEARQSYDEECEGLYDLSDRINRDYLKLKKEIEELCKVYSPTKEIEDYIEKCNQFKNDLAETKQDMDNNIYGHQPYSTRYNIIKKLKATCEEFKEHMNAFPEMAKRLKEDAENAYNSISIYAQKIKMAKKEIDNCNLPLLSKKYADRLFALEDKLNILIKSLSAPVKIQIALAVKRELDVETARLQEDIERKVNLMHYCEELIVITNRYRLNFGEVNNAVSRAVAFFNEGEFDSIVPLLLKLSNFEIDYPSYEDFQMQTRG